MSKQGQYTNKAQTLDFEMPTVTYLTDPIDVLQFSDVSILGVWGTTTAPAGTITDEYSSDGINWLPGFTSADLAIDTFYDFQYSGYPYRYVRLVIDVIGGGGAPDQMTFTIIKK